MNENDVTELDEEIMQAAGELAAEVTPARDLWPGIEASIADSVRPSGSVWNSVWAKAAAVVLLVGGSSGLTYLVTSAEDFPTQPAAGSGIPGQLVFEPVSGSFGSKYSLGNEYQVAHNELDAKLNEQLEQLPAETSEDVRQNIATIRAAIREINIALAKEPDNVLLQELLLNTYRDEMDLMITVDGLANAVVRREDI